MLASSPVPSPEQLMNGFPLDPSESAPSPLGPAVSSHPSPRRSPLGELAEPLAPFGVRAAQPAAPAPAAPLAPAPDLDPDIGLDFVEPLPSLAPDIDAIDSGSGAVDDLPWIELDEPEEESTTEPAPAPALAEGSKLWAAAAPVADRTWDEPAPAPAPLEPVSTSPAPASDAIAGRLEEIARTLREHGPAGLLVADQKDPLHLLIAGYALGQAAAAERGGAGKE
jgi:hypothetical protein